MSDNHGVQESPRKNNRQHRRSEY